MLLCVWALNLKDIFFFVTFHHIMQFLDICNSFQYYFIFLFLPTYSVINRHVSLTLAFHEKLHSVRDDMFFKDQCQFFTHYLYDTIY